LSTVNISSLKMTIMMNTMDVETATAEAGATRTTNSVETVRDAGDGYLMFAVIRSWRSRIVRPSTLQEYSLRKRIAPLLAVRTKRRQRIEIKGLVEVNVAHDFSVIIERFTARPDHIVADFHGLLKLEVVHDRAHGSFCEIVP